MRSRSDEPSPSDARAEGGAVFTELPEYDIVDGELMPRGEPRLER